MQIDFSFQDIDVFPRANWEVDVDWVDIEGRIDKWNKDYNLKLEPDFQRGHVWTDKQRSSYIEYCLKEGETSRVIIFNCSLWNSGMGNDITLIDGLQRLTSVRKFMNNEVRAFGRYYKDFSGILRYRQGNLKFRMLELQTRADILAFYLSFNSGGTVHPKSELERVRMLLKNELIKRK